MRPISRRSLLQFLGGATSLALCPSAGRAWAMAAEGWTDQRRGRTDRHISSRAAWCWC